jgi:hypothetical protein
MSQYQPPFQPDYASYGIRPPNPRPTSVTVIAIIAIIFGSLAVLGFLCSLPQYLGLKIAPNPVMDAMQNDPVIRWFMIITMGIGTVLAIVQLCGGIGALSLKRGSRRALIWYAVLYLIVGVLSLVMNVAVIGRHTQAAVNRSLASNPLINNPTMKTSMQYGTYGGYCFQVVFQIWPILILYFMSRPHVKAAFEGGGSGGFGAPPAPPGVPLGP